MPWTISSDFRTWLVEASNRASRCRRVADSSSWALVPESCASAVAGAAARRSTAQRRSVRGISSPCVEIPSALSNVQRPMAESGGTFRTFGPFDVPDFPSRVVRVFVPSGIRKNQRRPVLYMFDGQNVFGDEGSFAGGWHADQAVAALD